ncbi:hypothetical protein G3I60_30805 [Streptomyces sp. SID13666]|nr:hypothetical protein [Streptomyces sp. SID13666]NEA73607.1 hypothetical protein [Streptomyces sp. SID13588]
MYIVAVAALFFLAFAFFAVGQASVVRNSAQTAADASALAAARSARDDVKDAFNKALIEGDLSQLGDLLAGAGMNGAGACEAAATMAVANHADRQICDRTDDPPGYTVGVRTQGTVGKSVIDGTENKHALANATAVVEPRCTVRQKDGKAIKFSCNGGEDVSVDPTANGFRLDLSLFFTVHLSK